MLENVVKAVFNLQNIHAKQSVQRIQNTVKQNCPVFFYALRRLFAVLFFKRLYKTRRHSIFSWRAYATFYVGDCVHVLHGRIAAGFGSISFKREIGASD